MHVFLALKQLGEIRELSIRLVDGALDEHGEREAHIPKSARRAVRRLGWLGLAQRLRGQPGHNQPSLNQTRVKQAQNSKSSFQALLSLSCLILRQQL